MERAIGDVVKQIRKAKTLTLKDLSAISGLSVSYLSTIERGVNSPTIANLQIICNALDITMNELLASLNKECVVVKQEERRLVFDNGKSVKYEAISEGNNHLKGLVMYVTDNAFYRSSKHISDELGYVLKGKICMTLDGVKYDLSEGDTLYIKANTEHSFQKAGTDDCIMLWVYHNVHSDINMQHQSGVIKMHP